MWTAGRVMVRHNLTINDFMICSLKILNKSVWTERDYVLTVHTWRSHKEDLKHPNYESVAAYECHTQNWKQNNRNEEERLPLQRVFFATLNFVNIAHTFAYFVFGVFR
jgi:hypothetical protein